MHDDAPVIYQDGMFYKLLNKFSVGVYSTDEFARPRKICIPEKIEGFGLTLSVTQILPNAFARKKIKEITLPPCLVSIQHHAFEDCYNLTSIDIPEGIKVIENGTFSGCRNLTDIKLPSALEIIGNCAFQQCKIERMEVPDTVYQIGDCAFAFCGNLVSITLPDMLYDVGNGLFIDCYRLTAIDLPSMMRDINKRMFDGCWNLQNIKFSNRLKSIGDFAFARCRSLKLSAFPETLKTIGESAFTDCDNIIELKLHRGLNAVECYAFSNCKNLKNLNLSVVNNITIKQRAFFHCNNLESVVFPMFPPKCLDKDWGINIDQNTFSMCVRLQYMTVKEEMKNAYSLIEGIRRDSKKKLSVKLYFDNERYVTL